MSKRADLYSKAFEGKIGHADSTGQFVFLAYTNHLHVASFNNRLIYCYNHNSNHWFYLDTGRMLPDEVSGMFLEMLY